MADRLGLEQSEGNGPDLVSDGSREEDGRRDHRSGGVSNHRGSVDYPQAPEGRPIGETSASDLSATHNPAHYDHWGLRLFQEAQDAAASTQGPRGQGEETPRARNAPAVSIPIRNQTMEGIGNEPSSLVPAEQTQKDR